MEPLRRVEDALNSCLEHNRELKSRAVHVDLPTWTRDVEIQSHLAEFLLVVIYAEFEHAIQGLVVERLCKSGDSAVANFARQAAPRTLRGLKISDLTAHLKKFAEGSGSRFQAWVGDADNARAKDDWDTLLRNRHGSAHQEGSGLTCEEVEGFYRSAFAVLEEFEACLNLA